MATMFKTITTQQKELDEQKEKSARLRAEFDKMMAYMTEDGKKRIFGYQ
jgi:hypothetical protein